LSILGINLFNIFGGALENIRWLVGPYISQLFGDVGYVAGSTINASADIVSGVAKTGVNLADGAVHSVGNLLKDRTNPGIVGPAEIDIRINDNRIPNHLRLPEEDRDDNPIQNPITSNKAGWCLVGEYQSRRGCIEVGEADRCMSGQVFPTQKMCLNPTMPGGW